MSTPATENFTLERATSRNGGGPWDAEEGDLEEEEASLPHKREKSVTIDLSESFTTQPDAAAQQQHQLPPGDSVGPHQIDGGQAGREPPLPPLPQLITDMGPPPPPPPPTGISSADNESIISPGTRRRRSPRPKRIVEVIEQLDTPAIRRSKNLARKQRRQEELARLAREANPEASTSTTTTTNAAGGGRIRATLDIPTRGTTTTFEGQDSFSRVSSPLSALTDMDDDLDGEGEDEEEEEEDLSTSGDTTREKSSAETSLASQQHAHSRKRNRDRTSDQHGHVIVSASHARKAAIDKGLGAMSIYLQDNELLEKGTLGMSLFPISRFISSLFSGKALTDVC